MQSIPGYLMCGSVMRKNKQHWKINCILTGILIRPSKLFNMPGEQSSKQDIGKDLLK